MKECDYIKKWVSTSVAESSLSDSDKFIAIEMGNNVANDGGLKGDVSDAWQVIFPNAITDIPDLYP